MADTDLLTEIRDLLKRFADRFLSDENEERVTAQLPPGHQPSFKGDPARHSPDDPVAEHLARAVPPPCEHEWHETLRPNSGDFARFCLKCRTWAPIQ